MNIRYYFVNFTFESVNSAMELHFFMFIMKFMT
jgi:hypothetical protein